MMALDFPYLWAAAATTAPASSATTQILIAALGSGAIFAVIGAIVTGLFSKKKLGAEATEIITKAASGVVTDLRTELDRARDAQVRKDAEHVMAMAEQKLKYEGLIEEMRLGFQEEMSEVRRVLQLHVAWDAIAIAKVNALLPVGAEGLPPAPPVLPASIEHTIHHP